jgi:hypothetical protein
MKLLAMKLSFVFVIFDTAFGSAMNGPQFGIPPTTMELTEEYIDIPGPSSVRTPIVLAACRGELAVVEELIYRGDDVNAQDNSRGQTALFEASRRGYVEIVQLLVNHGADVNLARSDGSTPLDYAIAMW